MTTTRPNRNGSSTRESMMMHAALNRLIEKAGEHRIGKVTIHHRFNGTTGPHVHATASVTIDSSVTCDEILGEYESAPMLA